MKKVFLALIRFYQRAASPYTPAACRFTPTCSQYAYEAITKYGVFKGGWLALRRLLRCNPFYKGDREDPVP
ncbi:MAG: membrane protein insertion efficiency factor YidD [Oscillospiraceae bacterium]|nr:membrane protein insertion efficiency factor YidD [Oscillospiraceae bacterium]